MGLGAFEASNEKFVGMPGMHGTYEANMAMQHCDVLIAIGARFDDRVIGNPKHFSTNPRKIIHIDIDPSSISKRVKVDIPIVGDVREVLIELLAQVEATATRPDTCQAGCVVEADQRVAQEGLPELREKWRRDQAAVRGREAVGGHRRRCLRHVRRRPAPDVGRAVLPLRQAAPLDQLRRPGHDGRRPAVRDGRADGEPGCRGRLHHRRRLDPDVHPGAVDLQAVPTDAEDHQS